MFRGITVINVDEKGRMTMPTKYREQLCEGGDSQAVVTIDTETTCLLLYPLAEWENIERKIEALPSFNKTTRRIQRLLIGHATEIELDKNGRVLLPPVLREYAGLGKRIVLVGQGKKFEIWDETQWQENRDKWLEEESQDKESIPEELLSISL